MAATVELIEPSRIYKNPDNPRLIFQAEELSALEESIREQGILVPLTVYRDKKQFTLLDGERRWRCAIRLGLHRVPAIIQDKPDRVTNIMMMFAIHNARQDWDPLPTALKLEELEGIIKKATGESPTERRLAAAASLSIGEIRRYRKILALPRRLRRELMDELKKPREEQRLTVDHVIEAVDGFSRLAKTDALPKDDVSAFLDVTVDKFRTKVLRSTVEPRKLSRIARALERKEVSVAKVKRELDHYSRNPTYSIEDIFRKTVEAADYSHGTEQLVRRALVRLKEINKQGIEPSSDLMEALKEFVTEAKAMLR